MATTHEPKTSKTKTKAPPQPAANPDAPSAQLAQPRQLADDETELRRVIAGEFAAAIEAARDAVAAVDDNAMVAVHEYRKALRRARAVLDLVANELPSVERQTIRRALRDARRTAGAVRNGAVAPVAVDQLALDAGDAETARAVLENAAQSMPATAEIKQALAVGAARAAAQAETLEAALPETIAWGAVVASVRGCYRDARRARKQAKRSTRAFHTWRRRSKELAYQLQFLAAHAGARAGQLYRELEDATDPQGEAVDLIMLRDFVRTHGDAVSPRALEHLLRALDAHLDDMIEAARRAARGAFRRKPRKFARKLRAAVRHDVRNGSTSPAA